MVKLGETTLECTFSRLPKNGAQLQHPALIDDKAQRDTRVALQAMRNILCAATASCE